MVIDVEECVARAHRDGEAAAERCGLSLEQRRSVYERYRANGDTSALSLEEQEALYKSIVVYSDTDHSPAWINSETRHVKAAMERAFQEAFWGQA